MDREQLPQRNADRNESSSSRSNWIILAHILRPQGRKGEVLAELYTDFPERFESQKCVFLAPEHFTGSENEARIFKVISFWLPVGRNRGRIVLRFEGIDSISDAETLAGLEVLIPEAERLELEEDTSYVSELIGCTLFDVSADISGTAQAQSIGVVIDVHFATNPDGTRRLSEAAPLLVVERRDGEEVLVPFVKAFLLSLDIPSKRITMSLPPGLLDVNRAT